MANICFSQQIFNIEMIDQGKYKNIKTICLKLKTNIALLFAYKSWD